MIRLTCRYADDVAMNKELQEVERWNDPAAEFLSVGQAFAPFNKAQADCVQKKKKKGPRRPQYQGSCPTNRFGIRPGFRWDGVGQFTYTFWVCWLTLQTVRMGLKRSFSNIRMQLRVERWKPMHGRWRICRVLGFVSWLYV